MRETASGVVGENTECLAVKRLADAVNVNVRVWPWVYPVVDGAMGYTEASRDTAGRKLLEGLR
jgi:hypothetical protein